jgi:hypothetical protein
MIKHYKISKLNYQTYKTSKLLQTRKTMIIIKFQIKILKINRNSKMILKKKVKAIKIHLQKKILILKIQLIK